MMDQAYARLEDARRSGDPASLGDAHMAVVETLIEDYDVDAGQTVCEVALEKIQEHLDGAFETFKELDDPLRNAYAWVTQAAASAEFASASKDPETRMRHFYQAIDSSQRGLTELYRLDSVGFDLIATACSQVLGVLARLRELEMSEGSQAAVDEMIGGVSELMGEAMANDFRFCSEAMDQVHTARLMGLLADMEEDPDERLDALRVQFDLVMDAAETLQDTSAKKDAQANLKWARMLREQLDQLQEQRAHESATVLCLSCGHENALGDALCVQCGATLNIEAE
jgi:hypothetical protein